MKKSPMITKTFTMAILMFFLMVNLGFAGGNPPNPGDEKTSGPVVRGLLELTPTVPEDLDSLVQLSFYGSCKGQDILVEEVLLDGTTIFSDVDESTIINYRYDDLSFLPNKCVPKDDVELIISKIKSYDDLGNMKIADVMMFFIGPK